MLNPHFDNTFVRDLPGDPDLAPGVRQVHGAAYSRVEPTPVAQPRLLAYSADMARRLGFSDADVASPEFARVFGGNALLPGMQPFAANYGGHQFGQWAGQLGDGRAITLGEMINAAGERWELQLKGAGPTPYSRSADGRAVLRSSIREFLCSEAMYHLGVPTTRALSLVGTGEWVERDMFYDGHPQLEPGAVVCRVAPSFIRFGNFELPASRNDTELLRKLADFCIRRDFPELRSLGRGQPVYAEWFAQVCERTARLMAHWIRVGFVHGVMNTDNMSILGLTIDYGPYGWIDNFDPGWTPNTTDRHQRRYRFGQQPQVAYWNLGRLAGSLSLLFDDTEPLQAGLRRFVSTYLECDRENTARKLGLDACREEDTALMQQLQDLLTEGEIDMTLFFRGLADIDPKSPDLAPLDDAFYDAARREAVEPALREWLRLYAVRLDAQDLTPHARRSRMNAANPRYVLRNYLAQEAIDRATEGDIGGVTELLEVMRRPYDDQPGHEAYARRRPDWARERAGCSMLSCSS
ncbi:MULTISPECIES: YdiU family protein [unclassified Lysobacter]|uniref:protein adenylyltransferase SelO n=1 Tax=unclassified Lysobacter TaxID=2635362 RepID=UPI001C236640|nr:YdiU family protein [Lysobacter sp. MMG2]MBU8978216.1 YdiU family protein [Lysobacter sp. MMG2]